MIIPVFNESSVIELTVQELFRQGFPEIIVVDGGSTDDTAEKARACGALVVQAERGRARQMNAGAGTSRGEILLFLHADMRLPENAVTLIRRALAGGAVGGAFHLRFDSDSLLMRIQSIASNVRSYYAVPFGDQAIFTRRDFFVQTGGFREWRLMEDVEFARRMKRLGKLRMIRNPVTTSARRYEKNGFWRTVIKNQLLLAAFYAGVSPDWLARYYGHGNRT